MTLELLGIVSIMFTNISFVMFMFMNSLSLGKGLFNKYAKFKPKFVKYNNVIMTVVASKNFSSRVNSGAKNLS